MQWGGRAGREVGDAMKSRWTRVLLLTLAATGCGGVDSSDGPNGVDASRKPKATDLPDELEGIGDVAATDGDSQEAASAADLPVFDLETLTNSIGMKLVLIPAGEFMMGSPVGEKGRRRDEHLRRVRLTQPFYLQTMEVTQGQWESVMETKPWSGVEYVKEGPDYAASYVSWNGAQDFCRRLSEMDGRSYRLPTEAEWEYACRAGSTTRYHFGDAPSRLGEYAWVGDYTHQAGERYPHQVALKKPNAFGLYDMHGNQWEWVQDWYGDMLHGSSSATDPTGWPSGHTRVVKGGSWFESAEHSRSANRSGLDPSNRFHSILYNSGFRVVHSPVQLNQALPASEKETQPGTAPRGEEKLEPSPDERENP